MLYYKYKGKYWSLGRKKYWKKKLKNRTFIELLNFKNSKISLILQCIWQKILFKVHINQKSSKNHKIQNKKLFYQNNKAILKQ